MLVTVADALQVVAFSTQHTRVSEKCLAAQTHNDPGATTQKVSAWALDRSPSVSVRARDRVEVRVWATDPPSLPLQVLLKDRALVKLPPPSVDMESREPRSSPAPKKPLLLSLSCHGSMRTGGGDRCPGCGAGIRHVNSKSTGYEVTLQCHESRCAELIRTHMRHDNVQQSGRRRAYHFAGSRPSALWDC